MQLGAVNSCMRVAQLGPASWPTSSDPVAMVLQAAFIDADEFLVPMDGTPDLPTLLRDYERYGGLAVNWRMFGSNGHQERQNDTLTSYTACFPAEVGAGRLTAVRAWCR